MTYDSTLVRATIPAPPPVSPTNRRLSGNLSVYIDLLRIAAALAVFLDHAGALLFPYIKYRFLLQQGNNAVAVFFILSGFVIKNSMSGKQQDWRSYFVARSSRIYSVAILALAITLIADFVGIKHNAAFYMGAKFYHPASIVEAFRYLTFSNEIWFSHVIFGTDEPYWSLGFEVSYYIFFAAVCFLSGVARLIMFLLWFLVCGPKIALYLPLWLLGVLACKYCLEPRPAMPKTVAVSGFFGSVLGCFFVAAYLSPFAVPMFYMFNLPSLEMASFVNFTLIGLLVCINMLCFDAMTGDHVFWPRRIGHGIKWLAGATFTLYLVHQPLLAMIAAVKPESAKNFSLGVACCLAVLLMALAVAELGERRKRVFAQAIWSVKNFTKGHNHKP
jgi:peptidoglycan/LPS O-acetylase OafA/YrhL